MANPARRTESVPPRLPERTAGPISIRATAGVRSAERRNPASREAVLRRVSTEYVDMPGLRLTLAQAQRLFGLRDDICVRVLDTLVQQKLLRVDANGAFVRDGRQP